MKKFLGIEEEAPAEISSFKIIDEEAFACLKIRIHSSAQLIDYERFQAWLQKNHTIHSQIDSVGELGLIFRSAEMSAMMALYILKSDSFIVKYNFNSIDLAKFILKLQSFIDNKKSPTLCQKLTSILLEILDTELSQFRSMNNIAADLDLVAEALPMPSKFQRNNSFEACQIILKDLLSLLMSATKFCCKLLDRMLVVINTCNEVAYRAKIAVETIQKINSDYHENFNSLLNSCFEGDLKIITKMQLGATEELSEYLQKFKPPEILLEKCNAGNKNRAMQSIKKIDSGPFEYQSLNLVKISHYDISELTSLTAQLIKVREVATMILTNYDRLSHYAQNMPCAITALLPENAKLLSPLFHKYNSCESPLIAAIVDNNVDPGANLRLFSDLAKTMPYQKMKRNISLYGADRHRNGEFMSPLCYAVERSIPAVVKILLENNATVNPVDNKKAPLHRAMIRGDFEIVKILLEFGARPDFVTDDYGYSPLHHAQDADSAGCLIDWVATHPDKYPNISLPRFIDARDRYGNTPLHRVAQKKVFEYSRQNNLDNTEKSSQKHLRLMQLLTDKKADVNAISDNGHTALHYVLMLQYPRQTYEVHLPTVMTAVKILVDTGANVNIISCQGSKMPAQKPFQLFTPLLGLFDTNYTGSISTYTNKENARFYFHQIAEMLINHGASLDIFDECHITPLIKAIIFGADSSVGLLLAKGANPNLRANKKLSTPLHYCMRSANKHKSCDSAIKCLEYLFSAGASPLLLVQRTLKIKIKYEARVNTFSVNAYAMQLILNQENEFSQRSKELEISDTEEPVDERFLRVWTALNVPELKVTVLINALEDCYIHENANYKPHSIAVSIFNEWLNFYRSKNTKNILDILCLDSLWTRIPNDLIIFFVRHFSGNPVQVQLLHKWICSGRQLINSRPINQDSLSKSVLAQQNFFSQSGVASLVVDSQANSTDNLNGNHK